MVHCTQGWLKFIVPWSKTSHGWWTDIRMDLPSHTSCWNVVSIVGGRAWSSRFEGDSVENSDSLDDEEEFSKKCLQKIRRIRILRLIMQLGVFTIIRTLHISRHPTPRVAFLIRVPGHALPLQFLYFLCCHRNELTNATKQGRLFCRRSLFAASAFL